jgi:hypothetical protein
MNLGGLSAAEDGDEWWLEKAGIATLAASTYD